MKNVTVFYFPGYRKSIEEKGVPHPKLDEAVSEMNAPYERLSIPIRVDLQDMELFLKGLDLEVLEQTGLNGTVDDIVNELMKKESFENWLKAEGIKQKDGKWYHDEEELKDIRLKDFGILCDDKEARFEKKFSTGDLTRDSILTNKFKYEPRNFLEMFNEKDRSKYQTLIPLCCLYVNFISGNDERRNEYEKLIKTLSEEFKAKKDKLGRITEFHRIKVSEGYENEVGYFKNLKPTINLFKGLFPDPDNNGNHYFVLVDYFFMNAKDTNITPGDGQIYQIFRPIMGMSRWGSVGDVRKADESIFWEFLLHELCHEISKGRDIYELNTEDDPRLMLGPLYPNKWNLSKKISDESVREAYAKIFNQK